MDRKSRCIEAPLPVDKQHVSLDCLDPLVHLLGLLLALFLVLYEADAVRLKAENQAVLIGFNEAVSWCPGELLFPRQLGAVYGPLNLLQSFSTAQIS